MPGAPPFATSWPSSPKGDARTLRDWLSVSYGMKTILLTGSLSSPPLSDCAGLLHGKACHTILRSLCSLTNRVPLPPLFRGQNKTPRNTLFISGSTVGTGYSATVEVLHRTSKWGEVRRLACPLRRFPFAAPPNCGGKVVAPATKGGSPSPERAVGLFSHGRSPVVKVLS